MPEENTATLATVSDIDRQLEQLAQRQQLPVEGPAVRRAPNRRDASGAPLNTAEKAAMRTERWLFLEEVREIYGFSESSLRYWRKTRTGPTAYRVGRRLRYPQAEIESWMREQAARDPIARSTKNQPASR